MLSNNKCPRGKKCEPLSNLVTEDGNDFVCIGLHGEKKKYPQDKFRHCFKSSADTDSCYDYDEYDILSVISVMTEGLLLEEMKKK